MTLLLPPMSLLYLVGLYDRKQLFHVNARHPHCLSSSPGADACKRRSLLHLLHVACTCKLHVGAQAPSGLVVDAARTSKTKEVGMTLFSYGLYPKCTEYKTIESDQ